MSIPPISGISPAISSEARSQGSAAKGAAETQAAGSSSEQQTASHAATSQEASQTAEKQAAAVQAANLAAAAQAAIAEAYSMRAAGKTWEASIVPFNGGYSGSVSNLPGASAYGDTVARVESSLGNLISFFA